MAQSVPVRQRRPRPRQAGLGLGPVSDERKWELFDEAFAIAYEVVRELAKYQWYWDQRTLWLAENVDQKDTPLYLERREKRLKMTERWNELKEQFREEAKQVQAAAMHLGPEHADAIREEYGIDFRQTGDGEHIHRRQWAEHLHWNPDVCPF